ncbi:MAG TPA: DNA mismatch endonuclease Vsr [Ignavibacteriaceae bacterium]|nr:DNA mismatch endonuclease Vsr [Ignavibacteriaceae bacterium]
MDIWSKKKRSEVMSKIRGKNTKPEIILRSLLFKEGFRFRLHRKDLPGKPDIILPKYNTVIFVHGCFWHHHKNCIDGKIPLTNSDFWKNKIITNLTRDKKNIKELKKAKWKVITVWECDIEKYPAKTLNVIKKKILK